MKKNNLLTTAILSVLLVGGLTACSPQQNASNGTASSATSGSALSDEELKNKADIAVRLQSGSRAGVSKVFDLDSGSDYKGAIVYALENKAQTTTALVKSDGSKIIIGQLFDDKGTDLTEALLVEHGGKMSTTEIANNIKGEGFVVGKSGPILTAFFEPYCGYCNKLYEDLKPRIDKGELRVRFIMVGFLRGEDSLNVAGSIMSASDPGKELDKWEKIKDKSKPHNLKASDELKNKVNSNNQLMNNSGFTGTPAMVYCDNTTGKVEKLPGVPYDFESFLKKVSTDGHEICK